MNTVIDVIYATRKRIYNRHGVFDTNRLRLIIYTPLLANKNAYLTLRRLVFHNPEANKESSEVFDIIKPGRKVKIKGYRQ